MKSKLVYKNQNNNKLCPFKFKVKDSNNKLCNNNFINNN